MKVPRFTTQDLRNSNAALKRWAEREGVEPFTFYAARHTWASLARRAGVEKATIDDALGHRGGFRCDGHLCGTGMEPHR